MPAPSTVHVTSSARDFRDDHSSSSRLSEGPPTTSSRPGLSRRAAKPAKRWRSLKNSKRGTPGFCRRPRNISSGCVVVMGGYIGSTASGITTTLGRGGSDYSAAIAGAALNAEEIQIWTDVDGMMTTDPRIGPNAWKVREISFDEASELAYFGAKVLHPLTVLPAVEKNIPVYILNSRRPAGTGTRITREARPCRNLIKPIAVKRGITVLTVSSSRMLMAHGFLKALFEVFDRHRTSVDMVATSEVSVSLTLDNVSSLNAIVEDLRQWGMSKWLQ